MRVAVLARLIPPPLTRWAGRLPDLAWVLAVTSFINRMGGMAKAFMAVYLHESLGVALDTAGLLLVGYGIGLLVGSYLISVLADHFSPRKLGVRVLIGYAAVLLMLLMASSVWLLAVLMVLTGMLEAGYRPVVSRLMMESCSSETRPKAMALHRVAINLGFAVGGFLGGSLAAYDYRLVFGIDAATSLLAAWWLWLALRRLTVPEAPRQSRHEVQQGQSPYRDGPYLLFLVVVLLSGVVYEQLNGMYGPYLREHAGLSPQVIGWTFALNGVMVACLQVPITARAQGWGLHRAIPLGLLIVALGMLMLPWSRSLWMVLLASVVWTLGELLWMPMQAVMAMQRADGRQSGHYLGLYSTTWSLSMLAAPLLGSQLYTRLGGDWVWWMSGAVGTVAAVLAGSAVRRMQG